MDDLESIQRRIYDAVVRRGYRDGWTAEQFAARQVAKVAEELGELARHVHIDHGDGGSDHSTLAWSLTISAREGRRIFDDTDCNGHRWARTSVIDARSALAELADIMVVACCMAEALGELCPDMDTDLMRAALQKADADVTRGVRE